MWMKFPSVSENLFYVFCKCDLVKLFISGVPFNINLNLKLETEFSV